MATIDPVTLEVLRHRLMMINDEQGRVASRLSGSPVVYEAKDFNSALLTPEGESLFIGVYMTRLSLCLSAAVKTVIARFGAVMPFKPGDAFVTNDPWAGAVHMNDILMFAPMFHGEHLVAWTGLAMHEVDVGGPNPGSFTVGTPDVYGEAPLLPPLKMIDAGEIRPDVEAMIIRNSRTSQLNGLDMRARIAAINRTRQRIAEVIAEYGHDTLMEAQRRIMELTGASFARRLKSLPDGRFHAQGFLDHDGNENRLYRIVLAMTKSGDRLKFDFTGTDRQARGAINCTRVGLESGVFSAILPMLCYDIPWSPAGVAPFVEIVSEEGTINNARHPAAVSMATVQATFATSHVTFAAISKMIACSHLVDEIQANWAPAWNGMTMAGRHAPRGDADARPFTAVFLDATGGSGARAGHDGLDAGGLAGAPAMAIGNVETYEKENPVLYVYRSMAVDSGGHGRTRGGAGMQAMIKPHGNTGPIDLTGLTHGVSQPESPGLLGGAPSSVQVRLLLRDADLAQSFADRRVPTDLAGVTAQRVETLAAKQRTLFHPADAVLTVCAGGGGYGDPLERAAAAVLRDVAAGLVSRRAAGEVYGVVLTEVGAASTAALAVDEFATAARRNAIRAARLAQSQPVRADLVSPVTAGKDDAGVTGVTVGTVGDAMKIVVRHAARGVGGAATRQEESARGVGGAAMRKEESARGVGGAAMRKEESSRWFVCRRCDHPLSPQDQDPKQGTLWREVPMATYSDWNRYGLTDEIRVREFCCPSCAHLIAVQVARKDDPILLDIFLDPAAGGDAAHVAAAAE